MPFKFHHKNRPTTYRVAVTPRTLPLKEEDERSKKQHLRAALLTGGFIALTIMAVMIAIHM